MAVFIDYYQLLGVDGTGLANNDDPIGWLKFQYQKEKKLQAKNKVVLRQLSDGYDILSNPGKRAKYDDQRRIEQSDNLYGVSVASPIKHSMLPTFRNLATSKEDFKQIDVDEYYPGIRGVTGYTAKFFALIAMVPLLALTPLLMPYIVVDSLINAFGMMFAPHWLRLNYDTDAHSDSRTLFGQIKYVGLNLLKAVLSPLVAVYRAVEHAGEMFKGMSLSFISHPYALKITALAAALALSVGLLFAFPPAGIAGVIGFGGQVAATLGMASLSVGLYAAAMSGLAAVGIFTLGLLAHGAYSLIDLCCKPKEGAPSRGLQQVVYTSPNRNNGVTSSATNFSAPGKQIAFEPQSDDKWYSKFRLPCSSNKNVELERQRALTAQANFF